MTVENVEFNAAITNLVDYEGTFHNLKVIQKLYTNVLIELNFKKLYGIDKESIILDENIRESPEDEIPF